MGIVQDSLEVVKLAGKFANPELVERVTKLNEQVLELSSKNVELQEKVFSLAKELQQASEKLRLIGNTKRKNGFIYHQEEPEPCCAHCFDTEKILIRIVEKHDLNSMSGSTPFVPAARLRSAMRTPRVFEVRLLSRSRHLQLECAANSGFRSHDFSSQPLGRLSHRFRKHLNVMFSSSARLRVPHHSRDVLRTSKCLHVSGNAASENLKGQSRNLSLLCQRNQYTIAKILPVVCVA